MSSETPVHFAQPFTFSSRGVIKTVEQNSEADIQGCIERICLCTEGYREDYPEFGIPPLEFNTVPLKLKQLEESLARLEPRATTELIESALFPTIQGIRNLQIEVS